MDVILRNDPSLMDFQSYNEFTSDDVYDSEIFVEGAVGDKLKKIYDAIVRFIKKLIAKIRGYFASRRVNGYQAMINDPEIAEELKKHTDFLKWDTELNKQIFELGTSVVEIATNAFTTVKNTKTTDKLDDIISKINRKRNDIVALVKKTQQQEGPNEMWSEYDAISAIIDETVVIGRYEKELEFLYDAMQAHSAGKLDYIYGDNAEAKSKMTDLLAATYNALLPLDEAVYWSTNKFDHVAQDAGKYLGHKSKKGLAKAGAKLYKAKYGKSAGTIVPVYKEQYTDDGMFEEGVSLDELDAYIEYAMDDLHDAMELRNRLIQESDDDTVEDFEESETTDETPDDVEECGDGCKPTTEYYSDAIVRNYDEPVQENKTYCLKSNDMFTESYDEPTGPNRFYQETDPSIEAAAKAAKGVLKWAGIGINTGFIIAVSAEAIAAIKVIDSVATSLTYNKKLGRFPSDIKRTMDILKNSKDGTTDTSQLVKALKDVKSEARALSGKGVISYKANKNATYAERDELKKLYRITEDLLNMLSKKPDKAAARRVSARIEDFVAQVEKVMKLLNRGKNPGDVVKEYMS